MGKSHFEVMFINSVTTEEIYETCVEKYKSIAEKAGSIFNKIHQWGIKELPREINYQNKGYYTLFDLMTDKETIKEINRLMKDDEQILQHLILSKK